MDPLAMMLVFGSVGTTEILIVVGFILLLFGGKKIPELARGLGKGISEFRRGMREDSNPPEKPREPGAGNEHPESRPSGPPEKR